MCLECAEGFHTICSGNCGCQTCSGETVAALPDNPGEDNDEGVIHGRSRIASGKRRAKKLNERELKDPQSTGRHRAVALHGRANPELPCEWQGLANCGGGSFPILGCITGVQENLHHGPDKNTLNNERSNIHKICSQCHNRWHTMNDSGYEWDGHHEPHAPREPTVEDIKEDNLRWAKVTVRRAPAE